MFCFGLIPAAEIMHVINTGSVKDLKSLQSVGEKRAQLIHKWREMFGAYEKVGKKWENRKHVYCQIMIIVLQLKVKLFLCLVQKSDVIVDHLKVFLKKINVKKNV